METLLNSESLKKLIDNYIEYNGEIPDFEQVDYIKAWSNLIILSYMKLAMVLDGDLGITVDQGGIVHTLPKDLYRGLGAFKDLIEGIDYE